MSTLTTTTRWTVDKLIDGLDLAVRLLFRDDLNERVISSETARRASISRAEVRSAIDELPDSQLLAAAATVIEGWTPILLKTMREATDVDVLVAALRDRAAQFAAIERDAAEPFLTPAHLTAHLTPSPRRGE